MEITLWLVGVTKNDAQERFPFDSFESAQSYADDNPGMHVYSVQAKIDFSTMVQDYS